jgi:regulator of nucleoside diphosphate kinase
MHATPIDITDFDARRLNAVLARYDELPVSSRREVNRLRRELERAHIVASREVGDRVVTMNSQVVLRDLDSGQEFTCRLSFPDDANVEAGRLSVLAPVGTAILGYREGNVVEWEVPAGMRRIRIEQVLSQPEAAGDYHL